MALHIVSWPLRKVTPDYRINSKFCASLDVSKSPQSLLEKKKKTMGLINLKENHQKIKTWEYDKSGIHTVFRGWCPVLLRTYFWCCTQESFLAVFTVSNGMLSTKIKIKSWKQFFTKHINKYLIIYMYM